MQVPETTASLDVVLAHYSLLSTENDRLLDLVRQQRRELAALRGEDADQAELELLLGLGKLEIQRQVGELPESGARRRKQRGHGPTPQPDLPVVVLEHVLGESERTCPVCGGSTLQPLGIETEDCEEITIEMKRVVRLMHRRQKYRCACNSAVVTAPNPHPRLVPGGRYSLDFAVSVATSKIVDHMPLHRQVKELSRSGLRVTKQTLWDQEQALAEVLRPTYAALKEQILGSDFLHADETGFLLTEGKRSKRETLWVLSTNQHAWYTLGRKTFAAGEEILGAYSGIVIADGYQVYEQLSRAGPLRLAHCWAHCLRKFRDAEKHRPRECAQILKLIGALYEIEREIDALDLETADTLLRRAEARKQRSSKVIAAIKAWALSQTGLPRSDFIKAVKYVLARWEGLTRFLEDARLPLDNNRAENALRGPVLGRKNYLQFRSRRGCEVGAILYSLCETARLHGVAPDQYLRVAAQRTLRKPGTATFPDQI